MSTYSQSFSREYLQGLPEKVRKEAIEQAIGQITDRAANEVQQSAIQGKKTYMYDPAYQYNSLGQNQETIPNDDLIAAFQKKFPGCAIAYKEDWVDSGYNTRQLKKGILIDWS